MRQAIVTKYLGPTDTKGSRVVATAQAGRVIVAWEYAEDTIHNHHRAASELADKFGWRQRRSGPPKECMRGGYLPNGAMVWVLP